MCFSKYQGKKTLSLKNNEIILGCSTAVLYLQKHFVLGFFFLVAEREVSFSKFYVLRTSILKALKVFTSFFYDMPQEKEATCLWFEFRNFFLSIS